MSDHDVGAPKLRHVFTVLGLIGSHGGVDRALLIDETGLSRASLSRLLRAIRSECGVRLIWDRPAREYHIADWGIFDGPRLLRHLNRRVASQ